jgi:hypothetical protein
MPSYISSNNNRLYVGVEPAYGNAAAAEQLSRIPAVSLKAKHQREELRRRDKTGSRTYFGLPSSLKRETTFELRSYMTGWTDPMKTPAHGALFEAALGRTGKPFTGCAISGASGVSISAAVPHGLEPGQAVAYAGEIRFVTGVVNASTFQINAAFSTPLGAGSQIEPTYTYRPGADPASVTILDCWSPETAVNRLVSGGAVDRLRIDVNGDFHEFRFSGPAADLIDSASFSAGEAGLQQFPQEPPAVGFDYTIIPGHLGQAWIGSIPGQFFTLASASVALDNNIDLRSKEFGSILARAIAAGGRDVRVDFSVYAQDDEQTKALYQAARQQSPMSVMFQLGQQAGQLCGVYLPSVVANAPEFDDSETRLVWNFTKCRAQGSGDDEIVVAFA